MDIKLFKLQLVFPLPTEGGVKDGDIELLNVANVVDRDPLSTKLSIDYGYRFKTVLGWVNSIDKVYSGIIHRDIPKEYYSYDNSNQFKLPKSFRKVEYPLIYNKDSILARLVYDRLRYDSVLIDELKETSLEISAFKLKSVSNYSTIQKAHVLDKNLLKYVAILNVYKRLIKMGHFDDLKYINAFIKYLKVGKEYGVFYNTIVKRHDYIS